LVKIISEPSVTRNAVFKVIRSNTEIAITPPQIAIWYRVSSHHRRYAADVPRSKVKGQGHSKK